MNPLDDRFIGTYQGGVDLSDRRIASLMDWADTVQVDQRYAVKPRSIALEVLGAGSTPTRRPALLVGHHDERHYTVLCDYPLQLGTRVVIDKRLGVEGLSGKVVCDVASCRRGTREEDAGRTVFVARLEKKRVVSHRR